MGRKAIGPKDVTGPMIIAMKLIGRDTLPWRSLKEAGVPGLDIGRLVPTGMASLSPELVFTLTPRGLRVLRDINWQLILAREDLGDVYE